MGKTIKSIAVFIAAALLATQACAGGLFVENFLSPIQANSKLGFGWHNVQANAGGLAVFSTFGSPRVPGEPVLKITVNPGDVIPAGTTGERAQLTNMMNPLGVDDDVDSTDTGHREYYAFSIYIPDTFAAPNGWGIPLQLHPNANAPA